MSDEPDGRHAIVPCGRLQVILVLVSLGAGVLMVYFGAVSRIEYDGWWHVFIARVSYWPAFWREVSSNAHPPLFFLLLKLATWCLGWSRLAYRAVSIASGVVSVYLVGLIAFRLFRHRFMVVLATLAFASSTITIIMANEVRSYMLAGMFLLLAVVFYLDLLGPGSNRLRSRVLFSSALTLAVLSHYSILFVLPIFIVMPVVLMMGIPTEGRREASARMRDLPGHLIILALPLTVAAAEYFFHIRKFHGTTAFSYLKRFFYEPGEPVWSYLLRVSADEIGLFVPIDPVRYPPTVQVLMVVVVVAGIIALAKILREEGDAVAAVVPATAVFLTCGLAAASLLGRYPFGGTLRHQYIVFPLALISLALLVDRWVDRRSSRAVRAASLGLVLLVVVLAAASQWSHLDIRGTELATDGFRRFRAEFPDASNIYLDQFSLILFFAHEHEAAWTYDSSFERRRTDRMRVRRGDREFFVYRDRRWQAHLDDPAVFRNLRGITRQARLDRMVVFHLERVPRGETLSKNRIREGARRRLKKLAGQRGLALAKLVRVRRGIFAELEVAEKPATSMMSPSKPNGVEDGAS